MEDSKALIAVSATVFAVLFAVFVAVVITQTLSSPSGVPFRADIGPGPERSRSLVAGLLGALTCIAAAHGVGTTKRFFELLNIQNSALRRASHHRIAVKSLLQAIMVLLAFATLNAIFKGLITVSVFGAIVYLAWIAWLHRAVSRFVVDLTLNVKVTF